MRPFLFRLLANCSGIAQIRQQQQWSLYWHNYSNEQVWERKYFKNADLSVILLSSWILVRILSSSKPGVFGELWAESRLVKVGLKPSTERVRPPDPDCWEYTKKPNKCTESVPTNARSQKQGNKKPKVHVLSSRAIERLPVHDQDCWNARNQYKTDVLSRFIPCKTSENSSVPDLDCCHTCHEISKGWTHPPMWVWDFQCLILVDDMQWASTTTSTGTSRLQTHERKCRTSGAWSVLTTDIWCEHADQYSICCTKSVRFSVPTCEDAGQYFFCCVQCVPFSILTWGGAGHCAFAFSTLSRDAVVLAEPPSFLSCTHQGINSIFDSDQLLPNPYSAALCSSSNSSVLWPWIAPVTIDCGTDSHHRNSDIFVD